MVSVIGKTIILIASYLCLTIPLATSNCDIYNVLGAEGIEVYAQGDTGYDEAREQFGDLIINFAFLVNPTMIAFATSIEDVQLIIEFVNNCDDIDTIVPRSGGHQYSATSSCNNRCLQLDLKAMNEFTILNPNYIDTNDNTGYTAALVKAGPGLSMAELYPQAAALGLVVLSGICPQVHLGGNWQSSGHGYFTHSLGSGMDYITSIDIVLADGSLITVSEDNNYANLFWALRGGSPGAFGIIVGYTFKSYYTTNFPHSHLSFTFYRFGNNPQDEAVMTRLTELYTKATESPAFKDSLDIGVMYLVVNLKETAPPPIQAALDFFGASYIVTLFFPYLGRDCNCSFTESDAYRDIIQGLFRNNSLLIQPFLTISDQATPASAIPLIGLIDNSATARSRPGSYTSILSSTPFDDNVNSVIGSKLALYANDPNYIFIASIQGGAYGGQFLINDPNRINTAHPYRDTLGAIDMTLRLSNSTIQAINNPNIQGVQIEVDNFTQSIVNQLPLIDEPKLWIPYSRNDINIENAWPRYYENDIQFYNELRCTKYLVDPNDLFKSPLTVTPRECDTNEPTQEPTEEPN